MKSTTIHWFERVEKGGVPRIFSGRNVRATAVPGDSLFGEIEVEGALFACSVVCNGKSAIEPEQFELALRSMLAGLRETVGAPHPAGVFVMEEKDLQ